MAAGMKPSPALRLASRTTFVFLSGTNSGFTSQNSLTEEQ